MRLFFPLTIISCITEIIRVTTVLVDINPDTWNMDVSKLNQKLHQKQKLLW